MPLVIVRKMPFSYAWQSQVCGMMDINCWNEYPPDKTLLKRPM